VLTLQRGHAGECKRRYLLCGVPRGLVVRPGLELVHVVRCQLLFQLRLVAVCAMPGQRNIVSGHGPSFACELYLQGWFRLNWSFELARVHVPRGFIRKSDVLHSVPRGHLLVVSKLTEVRAVHARHLFARQRDRMPIMPSWQVDRRRRRVLVHVLCGQVLLQFCYIVLHIVSGQCNIERRRRCQLADELRLCGGLFSDRNRQHTIVLVRARYVRDRDKLRSLRGGHFFVCAQLVGVLALPRGELLPGKCDQVRVVHGRQLERGRLFLLSVLRGQFLLQRVRCALQGVSRKLDLGCERHKPAARDVQLPQHAYSVWHRRLARVHAQRRFALPRGLVRECVHPLHSLPRRHVFERAELGDVHTMRRWHDCAIFQLDGVHGMPSFGLDVSCWIVIVRCLQSQLLFQRIIENLRSLPRQLNNAECYEVRVVRVPARV
jgi:hypothetical protein